MGKGYKCGGAGSGLDFRIQIYPSKEAMETAAPLNKTLGVVTNVPVTGWNIGGEKPTDPSVGFLLIRTGVSSLGELNILAYNNIQICPIAAEQYTIEGWTERTAGTYLHGSWKPWEPEAVYLFRAGDQNVELTGGWKGIDPAAATISCSSSYQSEDGIYVSTSTQNTVDLSDFGVLSVVVDSYDDYFYVHLKDSSGQKILTTTADGTGEVTINLSSVITPCFIVLESLGLDSGGWASTSFIVSEVKLLKADPTQEMQAALTVLGVDV